MTKLAKLLLALLIISGVLNVVFLVSIVNLKSSITRESVEEKIPTKDYGYTSASQPDEETSRIKEELSRIEKINKAYSRPEPYIQDVKLNAVPGNHVGKKLILYGRAELSDYYNYRYGNANSSHYSVTMSSGYESIYIYFPKLKNKEVV